MTPPVVQSLDADGIGWIVFDDPAGRANVFNRATMVALRAALETLREQPVRAVVIASAKERIFIAGADLRWLSQLRDAAAAEQAARDGQALFRMVADFKVPVVCAIHGACAGGGFELALACDWRVASEAPETVIGLPETGIGVIPGWGGCARLPRLIGVKAALAHILDAALVPATAARDTGLVDELVPAAELRSRAKAVAVKLAAEGRPKRALPPAVEPAFFAEQRKLAALRRRGQPAPLAVIDVLEQGAAVTLPEALAIEARGFAGVAAGEVAKNLMHVFFLKDAAKKRTVDAWFPAAGGPPAKAPVVVGIIGAGVMGSGIAQACAARGLGVMMTDVDGAALKRGVEVIRELFAESVRRGKMTGAAAHKAMGSISISMEPDDFGVCDLVIEAVVEDVAVKQELFARIAGFVSAECVLASNTSALPIEEIAAKTPQPERVIGVHFFNPVGRMPLVEIVLGPQTSRAAAEKALALTRALGKSAVICRSAPGFFVTRVLFFYLNAACRLWEEGVPTEAIDGAMRDWGWPMGPMRLVDEVGVDVTNLIYEEMKRYYPDRFAGATICQRMLAAGLRGRKNGASTGFYTYGIKDAPNPAVAGFRPAAVKAMPAAEIQKQLNGVMIAETNRVLAEGVLKSADDADFALLTGAGFPAFRGGLMRYAKSIENSPA